MSFFVGVIFALAVAVLAASNSGAVAVSLWPFPFVAEIPMYIFILAVAVFSFIFGALFIWVSDIAVRLDRFRKTRKIEQLEKQLKENKQ